MRFGKEIYREGVDISNSAFYHKLSTSPVNPISIPPTQEDFTNAYHKLSQDTGEIISIHISAKISDTLKSARKGKKKVKDELRIEVIDSHFCSVGLALVVMAAARSAKAGEDMQNILEETQRATSQIKVLGVFDTIKYLMASKQIKKATGSLSGLFKIKPLLTFENGEIVRAGLARSYSTGMDRLYEFVESIPGIQDLAIAHSAVPERAQELKHRLGSVFPEEKIHIAQLGSALGSHGGPGVLIVALRETTH